MFDKPNNPVIAVFEISLKSEMLIIPKINKLDS